MHVSRGRLGRLLVGAAVIAATGMSVPTAATAAPAGTTGPAENYLVLFKGSQSPADAAAIVARAGGTVVANYSKIGVLVASSGNTAFDETMRANNKVEGATATAGYATQLGGARWRRDAAEGSQPGDLPNAPATDGRDVLRRCSGTCARCTRPRPTRSPAGARRSSPAPSTPASTTGTPTCGRTFRRGQRQLSVRCAGPGHGGGRRRQRARHAHRRDDRRGGQRRRASSVSPPT